MSWGHLISSWKGWLFYDICISNFSKYSFYKGIGNQHLDQGPGPQYDARGQGQDHMKDTEIELDE